MSSGANRQSRGGRGAVPAASAGAGVSTLVIGEAGPPPTVLVRIRALLPTLPPSERRVAEAAIADPAGVAAKTISELAADCDTSETTVIRFCRAVGLKGYPELRIGLAAAAGIEDAAATAHTAGGDIGPGDSLADVVTKLGYADARAVEDTVAQVDLQVLERAVDAVVSAGAVDVYGIGASALIALDLHQKLHRIGHRAFAWPDAEAALTSAALLGRGDVAIGVSHTGATPATVTALAEAHDNGARTIAITNFPRSPITDVADLVLTTAVRETTFRSGAMASRIAALTVVDCLFVGVAQRNFSRTTRALERTRSAVQGARGR
ncbi:MurR/RpiR family transcriptional regulator [Catenulispora sp. NF23]|uniref:MurR/RpiR family transcriptional regulator n=1 Tax=Catenulispora pinistramenti TaxID=2705254 RepID=A0ABS5L6Z7_9ACTN|nr:MurR/RpiR family transcriptional regulator [Catenulispora pinistramenti]MBS2539010.1 MurR/RpiR family transcriptional regulator [Catenulispora pinistramenti]MBS2554126.1 MurR/RpiR family transcriptional regulator [Catenulispora pinistramenti]